MNLSEVKMAVSLNVNYQINGGTAPLYIQGAPGAGKSQIIKEICKENEWGLVIKYIANYAPEGYTGIPIIGEMNSDKVANTSRPAVLDCSKEELVFAPKNYIAGVTPTIMLMDDVHLAPIYLQQYLFEFILERKIGNHKLANNIFMIMAGNRSIDKALAKEFPAPISNRVMYVTMELDSNLWLDYAEQHSLRGDVISFVRSEPQVIDNEPLEGQAWCSPRSLVQLNGLLNTMVASNTNIGIMRELIKGTIGDNIGNKFISYFELFSKYDFDKLYNIDIKQLNNLFSNDISENKINAYIICSALSYWYKSNSDKTDFVADILINITTIDNSISSNIPLILSGLSPIYGHDNLAVLINQLNGTPLFDSLFEVLSS